jgi:hypothetical protein
VPDSPARARPDAAWRGTLSANELRNVQNYQNRSRQRQEIWQIMAHLPWADIERSSAMVRVDADRSVFNLSGVAIWSLLAALSGCGGGGDNPIAVPKPVASQVLPRPVVQGVFGGELVDEQAYNLLYVVMGDGTKIGYFGTDWSNEFKLVDTWVSHQGFSGWRSLDGTTSRIFNGAYRGEAALVSTTFDMSIPSLSGVITAGYFTTRMVTFSGGSIPMSSYEFNEPASVAPVTGDWDLSTFTAFNIAADGLLNGSYAGCNFTGSVKPSATENVFALNFHCNPRLEYDGGYTGFVIALPMIAGGTRLFVYAISHSEWEAIQVFGVGQR